MVRVAQEMKYKSPNLRKLMDHIKATVEKPHHLMSSAFLLQHSEDVIKGFSTMREVLNYLQEDISTNGTKTFHIDRLFNVKKDLELVALVQKSFGTDFVNIKVRIQSRSDHPNAVGTRRLSRG